MSVIINIILLVINISNVIIHSIGAYILVSLYKTSRQKTQRLFLIHLSITECLVNLFEVIRIIPTFFALDSRGSGSGIHAFREYALIASFACVSLVYYCVMLWITLDRLVLIASGVNYNSYWNERKSRVLMLATWLVGICLCLFMTCAKVFSLFDWQKVFFTYFVPTLDFTFILLALITYSFIFKKYNRSQSQLVSGNTRQKQLLEKRSHHRNKNGGYSFAKLKCTLVNKNGSVATITSSLIEDETKVYCSKQLDNRRQSTGPSSSTNSDVTVSTFTYRCSSFRKSVYFIPTLLISTFLVFMVTPDLIYLFVGVIGDSQSPILLTACWISYAVSALSDAWIYLFMQRDVREALKKKLKNWYYCCCCYDSSDTNTNSVRLNIFLRKPIVDRRERSYTIESTLSDDK